MKIEEIDRLLSVVDPPLLQNWEAISTGGESLSEMRCQLIVESLREKWYGKCFYWILGWYGFSFVTLVYAYAKAKKSFPELMYDWVFCIALVTLLAMAVWGVHYCKKKERKASFHVFRYDVKFQRFKESVERLNPAGMVRYYWDDVGIVDEQLIFKTATDIALKIIDAQDTFDALCRNPESGRSEKISAGEWVKQCETWFQDLDNVALHHFALKLDKDRIFRDARAQLEKSRTRPSPSVQPSVS